MSWFSNESVMQSVLYIISKSDKAWADYEFIFHPREDDIDKTVVLLGEGDIDQGIQANQVYRVQENRESCLNSSTASSSTISYRALLDLIFSSDRSVVV